VQRLRLRARSPREFHPRRGSTRTSSVVGAETLSRIINYKDRNSCILFATARARRASPHRRRRSAGLIYSTAARPTAPAATS
jgi:hypothetical protein